MRFISRHDARGGNAFGAPPPLPILPVRGLFGDLHVTCDPVRSPMLEAANSMVAAWMTAEPVRKSVLDNHRRRPPALCDAAAALAVADLQPGRVGDL